MMPRKPPEKSFQRISVILGSGRSSKNLLDLVMPLLGRGGAIEMKGVFLEEAEVQNAAELPFVQELCRVTFSVREFNNDQFERALALRMRTAQRAISVLARRAGVRHTFYNVRGSAVSLLRDTANQSDITIFEPSRMVIAMMAPQSAVKKSERRIVTVIEDVETGRKALAAAAQLAAGDMLRISVLLTPSAADDKSILQQLFEGRSGKRPGRVSTIPGTGIRSLVDAVQAEGPAMLVLGVKQEILEQEALQTIRERLRCPVCLVRFWEENSRDQERAGQGSA